MVMHMCCQNVNCWFTHSSCQNVINLLCRTELISSLSRFTFRALFSSLLNLMYWFDWLAPVQPWMATADIVVYRHIARQRLGKHIPAQAWDWIESSLRSWQLQNNGKKGVRLWKDGFMCDLKWQWDSYKSDARIQLVKTENPSMCVMVKCKVCKTATALYCL
jgi:hypothetical protein